MSFPKIWVLPQQIIFRQSVQEIHRQVRESSEKISKNGEINRYLQGSNGDTQRTDFWTWGWGEKGGAVNGESNMEWQTLPYVK